jgi:hypothetical protein
MSRAPTSDVPASSVAPALYVYNLESPVATVYSVRYSVDSPMRYYKEAEVPPTMWNMLRHFFSDRVVQCECDVRRLEEQVRSDEAMVAAKVRAGVPDTIGELEEQKRKAQADLNAARAHVSTLAPLLKECTSRLTGLREQHAQRLPPPRGEQIYSALRGELVRSDELSRKLEAADVRRDQALQLTSRLNARQQVFRAMMDAAVAKLEADRRQLDATRVRLLHLREKLTLFEVRLRMSRWVGYGMRLARRVGQGLDVALPRPDVQTVVLTTFPLDQITAPNVSELLERTMLLRWIDGYREYTEGYGVGLLERLIPEVPAEEP